MFIICFCLLVYKTCMYQQSQKKIFAIIPEQTLHRGVGKKRPKMRIGTIDRETTNTRRGNVEASMEGRYKAFFRLVP